MVRFALSWSWSNGPFLPDWRAITDLRSNYQTRVICCAPYMAHRIKKDLQTFQRLAARYVSRSEVVEAHCWRYLAEKLNAAL